MIGLPSHYKTLGYFTYVNRLKNVEGGFRKGSFSEPGVSLSSKKVICPPVQIHPVPPYSYKSHLIAVFNTDVIWIFCSFSLTHLTVIFDRRSMLCESCAIKLGRDYKNGLRYIYGCLYTGANNTEMRLLKSQEQLHCSVALSLAYIPNLETPPPPYT